ncbi:unnamed protein product [Rotaria sp. Silwood2]|nr:unnamed protein product [Rotaria sp. Silwood2]CAF4458205.1 unnamed protein product [Rotaria sp. Silwood2]
MKQLTKELIQTDNIEDENEIFLYEKQDAQCQNDLNLILHNRQQISTELIIVLYQQLIDFYLSTNLFHLYEQLKFGKYIH